MILLTLSDYDNDNEFESERESDISVGDSDLNLESDPAQVAQGGATHQIGGGGSGFKGLR